jgi:hypothetical protein
VCSSDLAYLDPPLKCRSLFFRVGVDK